MNYFSLIVGITAGLALPRMLDNLVSKIEVYLILKELSPRDVEEDKLCRGPHSWMDARTMAPDGKMGAVKLCQICGFIPSLYKMATEQGIDKIQQNNVIQSMEEKIYKDFLAKEDREIKAFFHEEIDKGVDFVKLQSVHAAGMTFGTRFGAYKASRAEEITKALNRTDA